MHHACSLYDLSSSNINTQASCGRMCVMQFSILLLQSSCPQCSLARAYNVHSKLLVDVSSSSIVSVPSVSVSSVSSTVAQSSLYTDSVNQRVARAGPDEASRVASW